MMNALILLAAPAAMTAAAPCDDLSAGKPIKTVSAEEFSRLVSAAAPKPKSAYETTAAYQARVDEQWQTLAGGSPYFVIRKPIIGSLSFEYDADTETMTYNDALGLRCVGDSDRRCLNIHLERSEALSTLFSYSVSFIPSSQDYNPYPVLHVSPEKARSIREGDIMLYGAVDLLIVASLEPPYLTRRLSTATLSDGTSHESDTIPVRLFCTAWSIRAKR